MKNRDTCSQVSRWWDQQKIIAIEYEEVDVSAQTLLSPMLGHNAGVLQAIIRLSYVALIKQLLKHTKLLRSR